MVDRYNKNGDVAGCNTNENTKINGKGITLFAFPNLDESLIEKWEENSRLKLTPDKSLDDFKLCELHFELDAFTSADKNCLIPGAVPTIFEFDNKRKIKEEADSNTSDDSLPKQRKMQDGEQEPEIEIIPERNATVQSALEPPETRKPADEPPTANGLTKENCSAFAKQIDSGKKVYRLIIRIDRVSDKTDIDEPNLAQRVEPNPLKSSLTLPNNSRALKLCMKNGCKLMKTTLNSNPVFQCERCAKYYAVKGSSKKATIWKCYICQEVLSTPDLLRYHIRNHFTCDICQAQCSTQISYDKHLRLHVSTDPLLPYKCHKCLDTFEVKAEVRQHCLEKHDKNRDHIYADNKKSPSLKKGQVNLFQCEYCYVIFKKEQAYKSHINLHTGNRDFDCDSCDKRFKTAKHLAAHQARHSDPLKFSCQVCSKEFESEKAFETHNETHVKVNGEEHKCNICKKIFKNESLLGIHVRGHLSRAHRCPTCRKAFINKTTLRIHFKTHEKASNTNGRKPISTKVYTCSLCLDTFNSPARLYKHVMSHLEQMHGEEGDDTVFDGIDELLESDDDILS